MLNQSIKQTNKQNSQQATYKQIKEQTNKQREKRTTNYNQTDNLLTTSRRRTPDPAIVVSPE